MDIIKPRIMKGTRDFLPEDMYLRQEVIRIITDHFVRYGFQPLATPAMEYFDVLTGKYGDEGEGLIFDLAYKGGREVALKYDLTVPMCRVIAQYQDKIVMPFKRYQIQPVWRAEKPQKGRLREFFQCDADVVGVAEVSADAEIVALITDIMTALGFENAVTQINHRGLLTGLMERLGIGDDKAPQAMRILDKLDKVGEDTVRAEYAEAGFTKTAVDDLFAVTTATGNVAGDIAAMMGELKTNERAKTSLEDLRLLFDYLDGMGVAPERMSFSPRLARGLAYYTGPVHETVVETPKVGSLSGGGRYDGLIGIFSGVDVPATGMALGLERIIQVMAELKMMEGAGERIEVLVAPFGSDEIGLALKLARELRKSGVNTDVYATGDRLKKKFKYADRIGARKVVVVAPDEIARGVVKVKDMQTGDEKEVAMDRLVGEVSSGDRLK